MKNRVTFHKLENRKIGGYTTWGSMWKKGQIHPDDTFLIMGEKGNQISAQTRITAFWPDGSVKWAAHTADSSQMGEWVCVEKGAYEEKQAIHLTEKENQWNLDTGRIQMTIPKRGKDLIRDLTIDGSLRADHAEAVLLLEEPKKSEEGVLRLQKEYRGIIEEVSVEEEGPVYCVIKIQGIHENQKNGEKKIPFILRMAVGAGSDEVQFTHTFLYDGDPDRDYLKGLGIRFSCPMKGPMYNRHVKFGVDHGMFHEAMNLLLTWHPPVRQDIYDAQISGEKLDLSEEADGAVLRSVKEMPTWSHYSLVQDSPTHFAVRKKVDEESCCYLDAMHGYRAPGYAAMGGENGGLMFARRDFWQKYPSGFWMNGISRDMAEATVWFWAPEAEAMDFRHYAVEGYPETYYEGFSEVGATPYGIANTNEFSLKAFDGVIASDADMKAFGERVQKPAVYVGTPEYYHDRHAFGFWSLVKRDSEMENWLEDQLNLAVEFYKQEVDVRNWYGLFNYGDFMHTYDKARHCWRYDMGGYAWQNTELVPTIWLWLMFMRTGREDIFSLAESMSRHCSEVDVYHFGPLKGIGSRHNVRHWGCSCKEARIAMAGHHRYYYYLTGDHRLEDVFDDVKDGDFALLSMDPLRHFFDKEKMQKPTHARSGPDWSSFCSNWMTQWERFNDKEYENKIRTGVEDLKKLPLQLSSGPDFEYDPADSRLYYIGERTNGGNHLQICMGAAQTWLELGDLLEDDEWKKMMADFGRFYYMSQEERKKASDGLIGERIGSLPFMAAAMGAYGAAYYKDETLARKTWQILMRVIMSDTKKDGFAETPVLDAGNQETLHEVSWITTNFTSQWCLNVIMVLEFIREALPKTMKELDRLMEGFPMTEFHKA